MTVCEAGALFDVDEAALRLEVERREPGLVRSEGPALDQLLGWLRFVQDRLAEADPEADARPVLEAAARDWDPVRA
jgi:hypothetical protein